MRAFLAFPLPGPLVRALQDLRTPEPVRWIRAETQHLTVRFLGDIPEEEAGPLAGAVARAVGPLPPLQLALRGGGAFPSMARPRVLWVGLGGEVPELLRLAEAVEEAVVSRGVPPERRPYVPHVTVGRVKRGRPRQVLAALEDLGELGRFEARELVLFRSDLRPEGAVHSVVERVGLGSG